MIHKQVPTFEICPEDKLLLLCAHTMISLEDRENISLLTQRDLDWDYLTRRAFKHKLMSLLYWNINSICPEFVPPQILNILKYNFYRTVKKNLALFGELSKILKLFESYGIKVIPFKGPILGISSYENLALRNFNDLDLVISSKDYFNVKNLLISQGYSPRLQFNYSKEIKYIKSQRELEFINKTTGVTVDLHWKFSAMSFSLPKNERLYNERNAKIVNINSLNILSPSNEDLLLILCLHNAGHRWEQLSLICDIAEFIKHHEVNWPKLIEKADNLIFKRILLINLFLANDLLGLELPRKIWQEITFDEVVMVLALQIEEKIFSETDNSTKLLEEFILSFKIRENKIYGVKDLLRGVMIPTAYEWEHLHVHPFLFPILRPFYLLRRYKF